ncbi:hypothetical protein PENTCL1PPCAC_8501 [Pristionchus entomophagus]|uniref:Protein kinase domain-containing protein n=1 Tax=Pristionchus entomophagus TaxID=358040 RepID=A0AAV5ST31_9BILA|nr:hypothetical protein PENTCL1PPCAC_8501 [Pristionchus entomophagus]
MEKLNYRKHVPYNDDCTFLYIEMELCDSSLSEWLSTNQQRELGRMKNWFRQIVSAVAYIHKEKKIHRDLKPSNILIAKGDRMKICDLGIVSDCACMTRTFGRYTPMYRAPEQVGWKYSSKVDIFTLGLILVELCMVMTQEKAAKIFDNYRSGKPNIDLGVPPEVNEVINWLTSVSEAARPECGEILEHSLLTDHESKRTTPFMISHELSGPDRTYTTRDSLFKGVDEKFCEALLHEMLKKTAVKLCDLDGAETAKELVSDKKLDIPPDHAVAQGAAILAAKLYQQSGASEPANGEVGLNSTPLCPNTQVSVTNSWLDTIRTAVFKGGDAAPTEVHGPESSEENIDVPSDDIISSSSPPAESPSSVEQSSHSAIADQFVGKWDNITSENSVAYLREIGVFNVRKFSKIHPTLTFEVNEDEWTITSCLFSSMSVFMKHVTKFKLGQEFEHKTIEGIEVTSKFELDGAKLVQIDKLKRRGDDARIERTIRGDTMTIVAMCNGTTSTRVYQKI